MSNTPVHVGGGHGELLKITAKGSKNDPSPSQTHLAGAHGVGAADGGPVLVDGVDRAERVVLVVAAAVLRA